MSFSLPALLTAAATGNRDPRPARRAGDDAVQAVLQEWLARSLLSETLLDAGDLPAGWADDRSAGDESLFDRTPYAPLLMASVCAAFRCADTGERLEQEVAVLPRWALRDLAGHEPGDAGLSGVSGAPLTHYTAVAALAVPTLFRRGALVMALRYTPVPGTGPGALPAIILAADRKWTPIAEALA
ncbi:MAG TPA: hypothetical protein VFC53_13165 [Dehalococcoidia bacterium]|nr:hypothetical protein [Dehalococcoidia bacterium]